MSILWSGRGEGVNDRNVKVANHSTNKRGPGTTGGVKCSQKEAKELRTLWPYIPRRDSSAAFKERVGRW